MLHYASAFSPFFNLIWDLDPANKAEKTALQVILTLKN